MITGELKSKIDRVWDASQQLVLLDEVASEGWWVDVTLPMLELARLRIRGLVRFVEPTFRLIVDELTANGIVEPGRLFESPYTDRASAGVDSFFPRAEVDVIVEILHEVKDHARPADVA